MAEARVVGIDLGTTNSLVAYMEGDTPVVIPGEDGERLVPSVVAFNSDDEGIVVGNAARATLLADSANAVYSAKRLMGRDLNDIQEELKLFPFKLAEGLKPGEVLKLKVGGRLTSLCEENGVIGRAVVNDSLCFSPPLVISKQEIDEMLGRVEKSLDELTVQLRREQIVVVSRTS